MPHRDMHHEFFKEAWEDADHPMACVGPDNRFVYANSAFERLLGYSSAELSEKTCIQITSQDDVGGDLASVDAVISGRIDTYTLEKDYIHKRGRLIPVVLTVRRFPRSSHLPLVYFSVEAPVSTITRPEFISLERELREEIHNMAQQVKRKGGINVEGDLTQGDKVGRDKNSDAAIKVIAGALVAISLAVTWLFYYVASAVNNTHPVEPKVNVSSGVGK